MKNKILLFASLLIGLVGCKKDFLQKDPLDTLTNDTYWNSEASVKVFAWNFYPRFFPGYNSGNVTGWAGFFTGESLNDDVPSESPFQQNVLAANSNWTNSFTWIRRSNVMLEKVSGMTALTTEQKAHWTGVARFFRGLEYANRVQEFGDMPWIDKVLVETDPELYKARDSRTFVMDKVLADSRYAASNLRATANNEEVNKYTALAYMSRMFLFEGTWQKYHANNTAKANEYLEAAKWAANEVMNSGLYQLADSYRSVFNSDDLKNNKEVIIARRYQPTVLMHTMMTYHAAEVQTGYSKSAIDTYLRADGLPIGLSAADEFDGIKKVGSARKAKAMIGRDPRINATFADSLRVIERVTTYGHARSGYASVKFLDEAMLGTAGALSGTNYSDAPQFRFAEVLLNYAEAAAELGLLDQTALDKTINKLRSRVGFGVNKLPNLQIVGGLPAVNGAVYNDPKRDVTVPAMLWEIRRERRVEMIMEGQRNNDLRRWKKLHYADMVQNPDINRGAKIDKDDFLQKNKDGVLVHPGGLALEGGGKIGYVRPVTADGSLRRLYSERVYLSYIPTNEIKLYKEHGVVLAQNPGW